MSNSGNGFRSKRFVSIVLSVLMVLSMIPINLMHVLAEGTEQEATGFQVSGAVLLHTDGAETPAANHKVYLYAGDDTDNVLQKTVTDESGAFAFVKIKPGSYLVRAEKADRIESAVETTATVIDRDVTGITLTLQAAAEEGPSDASSEAPAETPGNGLAGPPALNNRIGGVIWYDENGDGVKDAGESGVAGYTVGLYDAADLNTVLDTTTTAAGGGYRFSNLQPGNYRVGITAQKLENTEYLLPIKDIQPGADNQFDIDFSREPFCAYSAEIMVGNDTAVENIHAALRGTPNRAPLSVTNGYAVTKDSGGSVVGSFNTLADAVAACPPAEACTITLSANDPDMGSTPVEIANGQVITLTSASATRVTITQKTSPPFGGDRIRHIRITNGALTLKNIVLDGSTSGTAASANGGGIEVLGSSASLQVGQDAVIQHCYGARASTTAFSGGAIFADNATVKLSANATLTGNKAVRGGAIYAQNNASVQIEDNASVTSNVTVGSPASGGGLYFDNAALTLSGNAKVEYNESKDSSGIAGILLDNGAIGEITGSASVSYNDAGTRSSGGIYVENAGLTMGGNSRVSFNKAGAGAGVYVVGTSSFTLEEDAVIEENVTTYQNYNGGSGGGVYLSGGCEFIMRGGVIKNNVSDNDGGGVVILGSNNVGGTIFSPKMDMYDGVISGNEAKGILSNTGYGGGIYHAEQVSAVNIYGGSISGNTAKVSGGGIYVSQGTLNIAADTGGGKTVVIDGNTATEGYGGGIACTGQNATLHMKDATVSNNNAPGGGGIFHYAPDGAFDIENIDITGNDASEEYGGGIYLFHSGNYAKTAPITYTIKDCTISNNTANNTVDGQGGGIFAWDKDNYNKGIPFTLLIQGNTIADNETVNCGGGIYFESTVSTVPNAPDTIRLLTDNIIKGNNATYGGGVFQDFDANVTYSGSTIKDNTASSGGGLYLSEDAGAGAGATVQDTTEITGNSGDYGGGVYVTENSYFEMSDGKIAGNTATEEGGGLYTEDLDYADPVSAAKYTNINIAALVDVSGNTAGNTFSPPANYADLSGFDGRLLTNDQINYMNPNPAIIYDANYPGGGSYQDTSYSLGDTAVVKAFADTGLTAGSPVRTFSHWSTDPLGTAGGGARYDANDTFSLTGNITLYAIWDTTPVTVIEKYHKDQNGTAVDIAQYPDVTTGNIPYNSAVSMADLNGGIKTIPNYNYVGYMINGTYQADPISAGPNIAAITDNTTITYVYTGVPITIKVAYQTRAGEALQPVTNHTGTYGSEFTANDPDNFTGWTLVDWSLDGGLTLQGNLNPKIPAVTGEATITLIYGQDKNNDGKEDATITEEFYGPSGQLLSNNTVYVSLGDNYSGTPAAVSGHTYKEYTVDGGSRMTGNPTIANVQGAHTVRMIYTKDVPATHVITEVYLCGNGCPELYRNTVTVNHSANYTASLKAIKGHSYKEYAVDGGLRKAGIPGIANVTADRIVYIYHVHETYQVKIKVVDENLKPIGGGRYDWSLSKGWNESLNVTPPTIKDWAYDSWKLDGANKSGAVSVKNMDAAHTVTLVYKAAAKDEPQDDLMENYEFVKKPNIKDVAAGQTVGYTFSGFGNKWNVPLQRFAISDRPDKGLDFVSAELPAFKNGAGVKYDVIYFTNLSGKRTLQSAIPADQPCTIKAPGLQPGEYITAISFEFGTVPAGFAQGDTMQMVFKVWDNPPSESLVNIGTLTYRVNDKDREFVTGGGSGSISISGWFNTPETGDTSDLALVLALMSLSLGSIAALAVLSKQRKRKAS